MIKITKFHLIIIGLAVAMSGVYLYQVHAEKMKQAELAAIEVQKESARLKYEEERLRQLELERKENIAIDAVAIAGEYWNIASKTGKDVATGQETLRSAKGFLIQKQFDRAYELAVKSIKELKEAKSRDVYYTVRYGDSLWKIAKLPKHYGNGKKWPVIWKANKKKIPNRSIIRPKLVILIPRIQIKGVMRPQ